MIKILTKLIKGKPKTAVLLRGGLAKAGGEIAMIRFIEEHKLNPVVIGSSSGGQIAGMYGIGYSWEEIMNDLSTFDMEELSSYKNLATHGYLFPDNKIHDFYLKRLKDPTLRLENLKRKVAFIATDSNSHKPVLIHKGLVLNGILATTACPRIIRAQHIRGKYLIDGDFSQILPNSAIRRAFNIKKIIGVRHKTSREHTVVGEVVELLVFRNTYQSLTDDAYKRSIDYDISYPSDDIGYTEFNRIPTIVERVYNDLMARESELLAYF